VTTFVLRDGEFVEKYAGSTDAPAVHSDEMAPLRHMADGKHYTSKAKFREATKAAGCVEIGNEPVFRSRKPVPLSLEKRREDIRRALNEVRDGNSKFLYELRNGRLR